MRTWNLKAGDPLSLTLAADPRLGPTDYCNDHIWELILGGGEPLGITLRTSFGMRARGFRLFPRFREGEITVSDPALFSSPPVVREFYPNFLLLAFAPFPDIEVIAEYWVPESHAITGRISIANRGQYERQLRLEWISVLNPIEPGQLMTPLEIDTVTVLAGQTDDLSPVVFLTGGAQASTGAQPALTIDMALPSEGLNQLTWCQAALQNQKDAFLLARGLASRNLDLERARIQLFNASFVEVHTGEPDWDTAFALAQKTALGLFQSATPDLPNPSFVFTRLPDQGFSQRGDGSDYNHLWNGQTPLETLYLVELILPTAPRLAEGLLHNFLSTQADDGTVDCKPGLNGQRSQLAATPLLAHLAWQIFQATEDRPFLEAAFPNLLASVLAWFSPRHDRDGDGIPEWDTVVQTGLDDHPIFSYWNNWAQGIDITTAESPVLCAFLYRECQVLIRIAKLLGWTESILALQAHADNLKAAVEAVWDTDANTYRYWDRESHQSPPTEKLGERFGRGEIAVRRDFDIPLRLVLRLQTAGEPNRRLEAFVHGTGQSGQHLVERVPNDHIQWFLGLGSVTTERVYTALERVEIKDANENDLITLCSAGYSCIDLTLLMPLWAGIPSKKRARLLVQQTLTNPELFWRPFGIRTCANPPETSEASNACQNIHLPWNALIGEGLVTFGYRAEAAELISHLMKAIVQNLKRDGAFFRSYHAETGQGQGERNALWGLPPLGLFLKTVGIQLISHNRVSIGGSSPFPWPVTIKYRGLTIMRQGKKTTLLFPDGQTISVEGTEPRLVTLE